MFKIGDNVRYKALPEGHPEHMTENEYPKGVGVIVSKGERIFDWYVDFPNDTYWPLLNEELEIA